jgi:hypothetical protein
MSTPPPLKDSLRELQTVVSRLNQATDTLNQTISDFETVLVTIAPGIPVWSLPPLRVPQSGHSYGQGSQLGFTRWRDDWRLVVRRGQFIQRTGEWVPGSSDDWDHVPLLDASREERAAALALLPVLIADLTKEAKERLTVLEALNKQAR